MLSDRPLTGCISMWSKIRPGWRIGWRPNQRWVCASPDYFRRHRAPAHPNDLARYDFLALRENDEDVTLWRFTKGGARSAGARHAVQVRIRPVLSSNDGKVICQWACQGMGIMVWSEWETAPLLRQGVLRCVLTDWTPDPAPVLALVPRRQGQPARSRAFLDHLKAELSAAPWRLEAA